MSETGIQAVVALGSNLGDSRGILVSGLDVLDSVSVEPVRRSSLWASAPVDCPPDSPDFVNAVAVLTLDTSWDSKRFLSWLKEQEIVFGRHEKKVMNEPRPLDLDLILFGDEVCGNDVLTLPHPRAHLRSFVMLPLEELAPDLQFPGEAKTVSELAAGFRGLDGIHRLD